MISARLAVPARHLDLTNSTMNLIYLALLLGNLVLCINCFYRLPLQKKKSVAVLAVIHPDSPHNVVIPHILNEIRDLRKEQIRYSIKSDEKFSLLRNDMRKEFSQVRDDMRKDREKSDEKFSLLKNDMRKDREKSDEKFSQVRDDIRKCREEVTSVAVRVLLLVATCLSKATVNEGLGRVFSAGVLNPLAPVVDVVWGKPHPIFFLVALINVFIGTVIQKIAKTVMVKKVIDLVVSQK